MSADSTNQEKRLTGGVRFLDINVFAMVATLGLTILLLVTTHDIALESDALQAANDKYVASEMATSDLMEASSYLTSQSRLFSTTYHVAYLDNYFWEVSRAQRRENDVALVTEQYPGTDAAEYIEHALTFSNNLEKHELYSMKLVVEALDLEVSEEEEQALDAIPFRRGDEELSSDEMLEKARQLVTSEPYEHDVDRVSKQVTLCKDDLAAQLSADKERHEAQLSNLFLRQQVLMVAVLAVVLLTAVLFIFTVFRPLYEHIDVIGRNGKLREAGSFELRFLAHAYNKMYDDNLATHDQLVHEAEHDALTGLFNRGAFEKLLTDASVWHCALVLVDIDHFKDVNDTLGHDVGDSVLKRVAKLLEAEFRASDWPCRIGGDEFAVVVSKLDAGNRHVIENKINRVRETLRQPEGSAPAVTLSTGVTFGDGSEDLETLYQHADSALYRVKNAGRDGLAFYGDEETL